MENKFEPLKPKQQGFAGYQPFAQTSESAAVCEGVRSRMQELLENDGSVSETQTVALHGHLAACDACRMEYRRLQILVQHLNALSNGTSVPDFSLQIRQQLLQQPYLRQSAEPTLQPASPVMQTLSAVQQNTNTHTHVSDRPLSRAPLALLALTALLLTLFLPASQTLIANNLETLHNMFHASASFWVVRQIAAGPELALRAAGSLLWGYAFYTLLLLSAALYLQNRQHTESFRK